MGRITARKLKKRKAKEKTKLKQRRKRPIVETYHGDKYRTEELVMVHVQTETTINQCFVMTKRDLTDHEVRTALVNLILQIRHGMYAPDGPPETNGPLEGHVGLLIWSIAGQWRYYFKDAPYPGRDNMIGVLRTILGSIETWGSVNPASRGYLEYLEGFLQKVGISVRQYSDEEFDALGEHIPPDEF